MFWVGTTRIIVQEPACSRTDKPSSVCSRPRGNLEKSFFRTQGAPGFQRSQEGRRGGFGFGLERNIVFIVTDLPSASSRNAFSVITASSGRILPVTTILAT